MPAFANAATSSTRAKTVYQKSNCNVARRENSRRSATRARSRATSKNPAFPSATMKGAESVTFVDAAAPNAPKAAPEERRVVRESGTSRSYWGKGKEGGGG